MPQDPNAVPEPEPASPSAGRTPSSQDAALEDLVVRCLERLESDGPAALHELAREHPEHADALRSRIALLQRAGLSPRAGASDDFPERLGDFDLGARLGAGGMGVVFRATQRSLGREVALKLIHPSELYFPGARERFRREVETVAQLRHPNVVPIYAVGEERGIPYFAMELVDGASLADVIDALKPSAVRELDGTAFARVLAERAHVQPAESAVWSGSWIDACLRIVREAAETLEYVHRRGVVHRDVKPSNVMLTRGGRILLVDFGLARGTNDPKLTRTGSQLGSLAYMAPEQLASGAVDARADVYGLGAVLWELVTLRPAFSAPDATRLQHAIASGTRPALATLNPEASAALATVLDKALAVEPERRYASAADFARDLDHLLARRPIEARRANVLERTKLWAARRPAEATAVALGVLLFVGAPTVIAWREMRARGALEVKQGELEVALGDARDANTALTAKGRELAAALNEVAAERDVAEANFRAALDAVDRMLIRTGDDVLRRVPQMERVRRGLLEDALEFCERFLAERKGGVELRLETAATRVRVAEIRAWLADYPAARTELERALAEFDDLLTARPDDRPTLQKAIEARIAYGRILRLADEPAAAERELQSALARLDAVPTLAPSVPANVLAMLRSRARLFLAQTLASVGRASDALDALAAAARELSPLADDQASDRTARRLLVQVRFQASARATDLARAGDPDGTWTTAANEEARLAVELAEKLLAEEDDPQLRADRAAALNELGIGAASSGDLPTAARWFEAARDELARLARDFPGLVGFATDLAAANSALGAMLGALGHDEDAFRALRGAVEIGERLRTEHPDVHEYAVRASGYRANLGWALLERGRVDEGSVEIRRAVELARATLAAAPDDAQTRASAAQLFVMGGRVASLTGEHERAFASLRDAAALGLAVEHLPYVATLWTQAAEALRADERRDAAERASAADAALDEALDLLLSNAARGLTRDVLTDGDLMPLHARPAWQYIAGAFTSKHADVK
ncbi:MAG: serine/threonine protein kinase [Planctomycetes bacterium]|nr:serine/threonine protein kinase [Planctomycetota bacterium]